MLPAKNCRKMTTCMTMRMRRRQAPVPRGAKAAKAKDTEVTAPAAKGPRSAAVGKEKAPRKSGKYTAHLKAEFDVGVSFSAVPVGKRFRDEGNAE